jgi:hypothetical protein
LTPFAPGGPFAPWTTTTSALATPHPAAIKASGNAVESRRRFQMESCKALRMYVLPIFSELGFDEAAG